MAVRERNVESKCEDCLTGRRSLSRCRFYFRGYILFPFCGYMCRFLAELEIEKTLLL